MEDLNCAERKVALTRTAGPRSEPVRDGLLTFSIGFARTCLKLWVMTQILPVACLAESHRTDAGETEATKGLNVFGHVGVKKNKNARTRVHVC